MEIYNVKLSGWASPAVVQASSKSKATELALRHFPKCDCCKADTKVESVELRTEPIPFYQKVVCEVKK